MCKERLESNITGQYVMRRPECMCVYHARWAVHFQCCASAGNMWTSPLVVRDLFISRDVEEQGDIRWRFSCQPRLDPRPRSSVSSL